MKRLRSKDAQSKAEELAEVIAQRKKADKREQALKAFFKREMAEARVAIAGDWLITLDEKTRTNLDRKKLEEEMGEEIHRFEKQTHYTMLTIRST